MADPDYFTLAEFRALPDVEDTNQFSDDRVNAAAAYIIGTIELEVGTSFIERTYTETYDGSGTDTIRLTSSYVRSVTSATVDGVAVTDTLDAPYDVLRRSSSGLGVAWAAGFGNVSVTYKAGYSTLATIPADIKEAAMRGTRAYLLETSSRSGVTDRRSSITNDQGTTTYVMPGPDHPTGYPMVDSVIVRWRDRIRVPRVA